MCIPKLILSFLLLVTTSSTSLTVSASKCSSRDRKVLLAIYAHFGSPAALSGWRAPGVACCDWPGVGCGVKSNRVTSLSLDKLNISGTIPPAIGNLPQLSSLGLTHLPKLVGDIPSTITQLQKLTFLSLSHNSLSGPIPDYLSQLKSLTFLDLSYNSFSGSIPPSLPSLPLGALVLSHNRLSGPIPDFSSFGDGNIFLQHNQLSGPIPRSLGGLGWFILDLSFNSLTGDASFLFGASTPATQIHLQHNMVKFNMSEITFPRRLTQLELNNNYIYGSIPAQINEVTTFGLDRLNVSYNLLCGQIPPGVVTQKFTVWSYFHNKCLCGSPLPACK